MCRPSRQRHLKSLLLAANALEIMRGECLTRLPFIEVAHIEILTFIEVTPVELLLLALRDPLVDLAFAAVRDLLESGMVGLMALIDPFRAFDPVVDRLLACLCVARPHVFLLIGTDIALFSHGLRISLSLESF